MIESPWLLIGLGAGAAGLLMSALWLIELRSERASQVDAGWAYGVGALVILDAVLANGGWEHRALAGGLGGVWGARLGSYLLVDRVLGKPEDGRYRTLRARWGREAHRRFLIFFQAQAALVVLFSLPFLLASRNSAPGVEPLEIAGACLLLLALSGELTADRQLARFRADPANRGKTCRQGLWRRSRHPNYFFAWLSWVALALVALAAPWGWIGLAVPALLLFLLFRVTGIPATEAQALASRGEDYRSYQRQTSVFVPWFPRRSS